MEGWIKLYRAACAHWVFRDSEAWHIWCYCLLDATHTKTQRRVKGQMVDLYPGQTIFGRNEWGKILGIDPSKVYRTIQAFEEAGMIQLFTYQRKYSVIAISNWHEYQSEKSEKVDKQRLKTEQANEQTQSVINEQIQGISEQANEQEANKKRTHNKNVKNVINEYSAFFEEVWSQYPCKKGKGKISDTQKKALYKIGEELSRCISRYKESKPDWQHYQNGSTFFNSGYIDYLDKNYKQESKGENKTKPEIITAPEGWGE